MPTESEVLLKEYDTLRTEVIERVKTAFSHLAFFGAVIAFAFQPSEKGSISPCIAFWLAVCGAIILLYISVINWIWVGRIATHLQILEKKINNATGKSTLTWEAMAKKMSRWVLLPPRKYPSENKAPNE